MKKIMSRAWEIAREAVAKFGEKVKMYFPQALKMAWAESRKPLSVSDKILKAFSENYLDFCVKGAYVQMKEWKNYGKAQIVC